MGFFDSWSDLLEAALPWSSVEAEAPKEDDEVKVGDFFCSSRIQLEGSSRRRERNGCVRMIGTLEPLRGWPVVKKKKKKKKRTEVAEVFTVAFHCVRNSVHRGNYANHIVRNRTLKTNHPTRTRRTVMRDPKTQRMIRRNLKKRRKKKNW
jgi:hypothetical protein